MCRRDSSRGLVKKGIAGGEVKKERVAFTARERSGKFEQEGSYQRES